MGALTVALVLVATVVFFCGFAAGLAYGTLRAEKKHDGYE